MVDRRPRRVTCMTGRQKLDGVSLDVDNDNEVLNHASDATVYSRVILDGVQSSAPVVC